MSTADNTRNQLRRFAPWPSAHAPSGARLVSLSRYAKPLFFRSCGAVRPGKAGLVWLALQSRSSTLLKLITSPHPSLGGAFAGTRRCSQLQQDPHLREAIAAPAFPGPRELAEMLAGMDPRDEVQNSGIA